MTCMDTGPLRDRSNGRYASCRLLYSSVLTGGVLLVNAVAVAPAYADACTGAQDLANSTNCPAGTSTVTLTYPGSNSTPYAGGDFTLTLQDHDVAPAAVGFGILFDDVVNGNGTINLNGASDVTSNGGVHGIDADANNSHTTINVNNTSSVTGGATGIHAVSFGVGIGGDITVNTQVDTAVTGNNGDGIEAEALDTGNVIVKAEGEVTGNVTFNADGIQARADEGTVEVTTGAKAITGNANGINVFSDDSTVKVTTGEAKVTGTTAHGIFAQGAGNATVNVNGDVEGAQFGIIAGSDTDGLVKIDTATNTTVEGNNGAGISANAGAVGDVDLDALGIVTGSTIGIDANSASGTANVRTGANAVTGNGGHGIEATGNIVIVDAGGNVTGTGGNGITAVADTGTVNVTTATGATVSGTGGAGITAEATGDATVDTGGSVFGGVNGINAMSSGGGAVNVTTAGPAPLTLVVGNGGAGINASTSGAGLVTITNATFTAGSTAGIVAASDTGAIQITNTGIIANASFTDDGLAISTSGGATTIDNDSIGILGRVVTGLSSDTLNNNATWQTEGDSDFNAGGDTVNNNVNGLILAGDEAAIAETTRFLNLETLNNSGLIDLSDQNAPNGSNISDTLSTSGNYVGGGGLVVDAFLGGPGSLSDQLIIGGNATGVTEIFVIDTNPGAGALNLDGILVVDVNNAGIADATNFVLANGPIDKGLFTYDLLFDDANNNYLLVGLPGQGVFETLAAVASNQEIWRETADAWSTRQENLRDLLASSYGVTAVADPPVEGSTAPMASLWVSALGSWSERDDDASFSLFNANLDFDLSYSQDIYGVVGGADFRSEVGQDSSLLFGVMAGYVDSNLDFDDSDTSIDTDGATVGVYAALMSNGFFATVLVKADLLTMDFSTSDVDGQDSADVTTIGARGDFGYRFGDTFFVEPMVSVDGMSTDIDEFTIAGADIDAGTNESFRAGAGVRVGYGGEQVRASATGRVWDVFSTDNEVDIPGLTISDDDLEGVYGDVSGQIDVSLSANATIYLKGGVLFSDDVTKPNASGGFALYW